MGIEAQNEQELLRRLSAAKRTVSLRGLGRSKEETEPWITHRLLPTLAHCRRIDFLIMAEVRSPPDDRPDLYISSATNAPRPVRFVRGTTRKHHRSPGELPG
jgi:hypothetical protein